MKTLEKVIEYFQANERRLIIALASATTRIRKLEEELSVLDPQKTVPDTTTINDSD